MAKSLEEYVKTYLEILDDSASDVTVPPRFWVFTMWDHDNRVSDGTPERAAKLLGEVAASDPGLYEVIQGEINAHLDNAREQQRLQQRGSSIIEILLAGNNRQVIPINQARTEAELLLNPDKGTVPLS